MIINSELFSKLLENLSSDDNQKVVSTCKIISIVLGQLKDQMNKQNQPRKDSVDFSDEDDDVMLTEDKESDHDKAHHEPANLSQNPLILMAAEKIPELIKQLEVVPEIQLESTMGFEVKILGQRRLQISQLLAEIIGLEIDELKTIVLPVYSTLLSLFFEFKENSFLHYIVESIFKQIFKPLKPDDIEKDGPIKSIHAYRLAVLKETNLLDRISEESIARSRFQYRSTREQRHCHIAFNTVIANLIIESSNQNI